MSEPAGTGPWDIAGIGAVAGVGGDPREIYDALCAGHTSLAPLRAFDRTRFRSQHAYEMDDRPGNRDVPGRATRWLARAVAQALADAGLEGDQADVPVLVGTTLRELRTAELWWREGAAMGPADLHFGAALRTRFGTTAGFTVASACAASLYTLAMATDLIALDLADTVVVAGTDSITESAYGGLDRVQPGRPEALRPFDKNRHGMLMGEGAVAVVLRRAGSPGGPVHARVRGVSLTCDGIHPTAPDAPSIERAIRDAHDRAGVVPADVDVVMLHGSGTRQNDHVEATAVAEVFARTTPSPLMTSVKSLAGHTCGGSGLFSLVMAVMAMRHGAVPPIVGLTDPIDEAAHLRLVRGRAATARITTAQVNAFAFGGINAVAIAERAA